MSEWTSFYVMTGSSAAALTGLMFVVVTLVTRTERERARVGTAVFSTPTVLHFCAALLISAILSAPWHVLQPAAWLIGLIGLWGAVYILRVMFRTRQLSAYTADLEDWAWYTILPLLAYAVTLASAVALSTAPAQALFALAAGVVLLIFIGIRNAWDIVTYLAISSSDHS